jgi:PTS system nitrogen regulatory IIA component
MWAGWIRRTRCTAPKRRNNIIFQTLPKNPAAGGVFYKLPQRANDSGLTDPERHDLSYVLEAIFCLKPRNGPAMSIPHSTPDPITVDRIAWRLHASGPGSLIKQVAALAAADTGINASGLAKALTERENVASSGIGEGIALPHMRLETITRPYLLAARLAQPLPFDAADGQPVDLLFLLLSPDLAGPVHLQSLSRLSRLLRDPALRQSLREAESRDAFESILLNREALKAAA